MTKLNVLLDTILQRVKSHVVSSVFLMNAILTMANVYSAVKLVVMVLFVMDFVVKHV